MAQPLCTFQRCVVPPSPVVIGHLVTGDSEQPSAETAVTAIVFNALQRRQKGLRRQVLGIVRVAGAEQVEWR